MWHQTKTKAEESRQWAIKICSSSNLGNQNKKTTQCQTTKVNHRDLQWHSLALTTSTSSPREYRWANNSSSSLVREPIVASEPLLKFTHHLAGKQVSIFLEAMTRVNKIPALLDWDQSPETSNLRLECSIRSLKTRNNQTTLVQVLKTSQAQLGSGNSNRTNEVLRKCKGMTSNLNLWFPGLQNKMNLISTREEEATASQVHNVWQARI